MDHQTLLKIAQQVKTSQPLVQCITNYVGMDMVANVLIATGASPAMVHSPEEVDEFTSVSTGVVVNIGTLDSDWFASMKLAAQKANELRKPWVLDPVAVGATSYRQRTCRELLKLKPTVIRGNASEIRALAGEAPSGKGVDADIESRTVAGIAARLARQTQSVVAMTGEADIITDGDSLVEIKNGHPLMTKVTATGCALSALVAAFVAANPTFSPLQSTVAALCMYSVAGERAYDTIQYKAPGSFRVAFIDMLYMIAEDPLFVNSINLALIPLSW